MFFSSIKRINTLVRKGMSNITIVKKPKGMSKVTIEKNYVPSTF